MLTDTSAVRRSISVTGEVGHPLTLQLSELRQLPTVWRRAQLFCAKGKVYDCVMRGVPLTHLFELARVRSTARSAIFMCSDEYKEEVSLADLIRQEALLAYWAFDAPEQGWDSFPRLCVPGKGGSRWAKGVHTIELC